MTNTNTTALRAPAENLRIIWPSSEELDTVGYQNGCMLSLYLDPDTNYDEGPGPILVRTHLDAGGGSVVPSRAWHGRWTHILDVGANAIGQSVLDVLQSHEDLLLETASAYRGSQWDGSNHRGLWDGDCRPDCCIPTGDIEYALGAGEWYASENPSWGSLCSEHGLDPATAEPKDVADAENRQASSDGVVVTGVEHYLDWLRDEYLATTEEVGGAS